MNKQYTLKWVGERYFVECVKNRYDLHTDIYEGIFRFISVVVKFRNKKTIRKPYIRRKIVFHRLYFNEFRQFESTGYQIIILIMSLYDVTKWQDDLTAFRLLSQLAIIASRLKWKRFTWSILHFFFFWLLLIRSEEFSDRTVKKRKKCVSKGVCSVFIRSSSLA